MRKLRRGHASPAPEASTEAEHAKEQLRDSLVAQASRVIDLFKRWDLNGDGVIAKSEVTACSTPILPPSTFPPATFSSALTPLLTNSVTITSLPLPSSQFLRAIPELGLWSDSTEVDDLFDSFDTDHSGTISFRELNRMLRRTRTSEKSSNDRRDSVAGEARPGVALVDLESLRKETLKRLRLESVHANMEASLMGDASLMEYAYTVHANNEAALLANAVGAGLAEETKDDLR